jgi:hypothetical protein
LWFCGGYEMTGIVGLWLHDLSRALVVPLSAFTIYSEDGQAAINAERYKDGKLRLETKGDLVLDKEQVRALLIWLGMEIE